jgi:hypothetical protein
LWAALLNIEWVLVASLLYLSKTRGLVVPQTVAEPQPAGTVAASV